MAQTKIPGTEIQELCKFRVKDLLCGLDIRFIQEINKHFNMTPVPLAQDYIKGIVNIRGQIVTMIDLEKKIRPDTECRNSYEKQAIIVDATKQPVGLLVDKVEDVFRIDPEQIEPPPSNLSGFEGSFFLSVYKEKDELIAILNINEILKNEKIT